jgi:hypothetical protein
MTQAAQAPSMLAAQHRSDWVLFAITADNSRRRMSTLNVPLSSSVLASGPSVVPGHSWPLRRPTTCVPVPWPFSVIQLDDG